MRSSISPPIFSGDVRNMSSVLFTEPSVEFSIGTTPKSAALDSTSWNTSRALVHRSFDPVAVLLGTETGRARGLGIREALLGVGQLLFQRAGVELVRRDRLLDQQAGMVAEHLQPAVRLGEAEGLGVGDVQPQLGRAQRRQQRRVVGEDAEFARLAARRDLANLAVENLPLGGEDLDFKRAVAGQAAP